MSVSRIAGRYAKSLLDLAIEGQKVDKVLDDVKGFNTMLGSRDLQLLLKSPIVSAGKKGGIFKVLFAEKFDALTMAFFDTILRKGREAFLPEIAVEFVNQYKAYKGVTSVKLTTATPVDNALLAEIKSKLLQSTVTEQEVDVTTEVDQDIIGGFVLEIGDRLYDNSIAHKLNEMKKQFSSKDYVKQF